MKSPGSVIKYIFELQVIETKRELYPPESMSHRKEIEDTIRSVRDKRDKELMSALEEHERKAK
jgi:protein PET100